MGITENIVLYRKKRCTEWFREIDVKPHIYTAYADDPETSAAFTAFKADNSEHLKVLLAIKMLNEGVHLDDISGVILFRPTVSPIIYSFQRLLHYKSEFGHVNVPVSYKTPDGLSLGCWCNTQRRIYRGNLNGILTEERIKKLNSIVFLWNPKEES